MNMQKFSRKLARSLSRIRVVLYRYVLSEAKLQGSPKILLPTLFMGRGRIEIGAGVRLGVYPSPGFFSGHHYIEARAETATISVGAHTVINNGIRLVSDAAGIHIGANCLIGPDVEIYDSDFHTLDPALRRIETGGLRAVHIGENVFIGAGVKILKGVSIGRNSVIGAGSVVSKSVPENVIVAGNPARVITKL